MFICSLGPLASSYYLDMHVGFECLGKIFYVPMCITIIIIILKVFFLFSPL